MIKIILPLLCFENAEFIVQPTNSDVLMQLSTKLYVPVTQHTETLIIGKMFSFSAKKQIFICTFF